MGDFLFAVAVGLVLLVLAVVAFFKLQARRDVARAPADRSPTAMKPAEATRSADAIDGTETVRQIDAPSFPPKRNA